MSQYANFVQIRGKIVTIHPPVHFADTDDSMVIIEVRTQGEEGEFNHRVTLINEVMEDFFHNFEVGCFISIEGCLRPRPKFKDNPNGEIFFEIRGTHIIPIQEEAQETVIPENTEFDVYPNEMDGVPTNPSPVAVAAPQSVNRGFSPSHPIRAVSINQAPVNQQNWNDQTAWDGDFCNYNGVLVGEVDFLNGAPIDRELPFQP